MTGDLTRVHVRFAASALSVAEPGPLGFGLPHHPHASPHAPYRTNTPRVRWVTVPARRRFRVAEMDSMQENHTQSEQCLFHLQLTCDATDTICKGTLEYTRNVSQVRDCVATGLCFVGFQVATQLEPQLELKRSWFQVIVCSGGAQR